MRSEEREAQEVMHLGNSVIKLGFFGPAEDISSRVTLKFNKRNIRRL